MNISARGKIITRQQVIETVFKLIPKEDIESVHLFGSCVEPKITFKETEVRFGFFGLNTRTELVKTTETPNDIDIMVFVKPEKYVKDRDIKWELETWETEHGYDYSWSGYVKNNEMLHLQITTKKLFDKAVANGNLLNAKRTLTCIY